MLIMKTIPSWVLVLANAALFILSTTVTFISATRTPLMHFVVVALALALGAESFWHLRKQGVLKMTPAQIYASSHSRRPRETFLSAAAAIMGAVAIVVLSL
jgi:hypothetical protein